MLRLRRPPIFRLGIAHIVGMVKVRTAELLLKHVSLRLSRSPKALAGGIGARNLGSSRRRTVGDCRSRRIAIGWDRLVDSERAKSSDREQQAA